MADQNRNRLSVLASRLGRGGVRDHHRELRGVVVFATTPVQRWIARSAAGLVVLMAAFVVFVNLAIRASAGPTVVLAEECAAGPTVVLAEECAGGPTVVLAEECAGGVPHTIVHVTLEVAGERADEWWVGACPREVEKIRRRVDRAVHLEPY